MIDGYYSEEEIAQFLEKKKTTLSKERSLRRNHPPFVKIGATVKYPKEDFHRWMHSRKVTELADEQEVSGRNPFAQKREKIRVGGRR